MKLVWVLVQLGFKESVSKYVLNLMSILQAKEFYFGDVWLKNAERLQQCLTIVFYLKGGYICIEGRLSEL